MDFNTSTKFNKQHLINICLIVIVFLSIQLSFNYLSGRPINWYRVVGLIGAYILAETIRSIYYKKGPV